jgi:uroporphyrinogen-III synthase
MKIIVVSDLTIFKELRTLGVKRGFVVEKHLALNIKGSKNISKDVLEYIKTVNNIIFQSKNAVKYSERMHQEIQKNKKATMYCLGQYTKTELKKYFDNEINHPVSKYSSENLLKLIIKENKNKESFMIIKGEGGRDYLERNLIDKGCNVKTVNTYERIAKDTFLEEKVLNADSKNYVVVSSKLALQELIKSIMNFKKKYPLILVIPNNRLVDGLNTKDFNDVLIICNSSSANDYAKILEQYDEEK